MNRYIVFLKQVPFSAKIKMDPNTKTLIRSSASGRTNPDDLYALEAALWVRKQTGGEVIAVSMGPMKAENVLRDALNRGADRAILANDKGFAGSDTCATSRVLASIVKHIGEYTALFFGKMATDGDTAQVGPGVAAVLDIPQITSLVEIKEVTSQGLTVVKADDYKEQTLQVQFPCAVMVSKKWGKLTPVTLQQYRDAKNKSLEVHSAESLGIDTTKVGLKASPTRVVKAFVVQSDKSVAMLNSVEELADVLKSRSNGK